MFNPGGLQLEQETGGERRLHEEQKRRGCRWSLHSAAPPVGLELRVCGESWQEPGGEQRALSLLNCLVALLSP